MTVNGVHLVFALGPVESFIAQSRRTADGWMGSYLISYLAGCVLVMLENEQAAGTLRIQEPDVRDVAMLKAIKGEPLSPTDDPTVAALPNTVLVEVLRPATPDDIGRECRRVANDAWDDIQQEVLERVPLTIRSAPGVKDMWASQVRRQWEAYWAWGATPAEAFTSLAARKTLRDFEAWDEDGDRCTVCTQRMPLVDRTTIRPDHMVQTATATCWGADGQGWGRQLSQLAEDGDRTRLHVSVVPRTLVRDDGTERLCAVCLIKRLAPWVENPIKRLWDGRTGLAAFPSTATMSTVEYRVQLLRAAAEKENEALRKALLAYRNEVEKADTRAQRELAKPRLRLEMFPSWPNCNKDVRKQIPESDSLLRVDGDFYLFGESVIRDHGLADSAVALQHAHAALRSAARRAGVPSPPIYWALLVMDGDEMGKFMRSVQSRGGDTGTVSAVLNQFADSVAKTLPRYSGRAIFAGGDDVLALLPVTKALEVAAAFRTLFRDRFGKWHDSHGARLSDVSPPTISAAIVYAHHQAPLGRVIDAGHALLKDWAKGRAGRDALALQRFMRGGPADTFTIKWGEGADAIHVRLSEIIRLLTGEEAFAPAAVTQTARPELAGRTAYNLRQFAWMLGCGGPVFGDADDHRLAFLASLLGKSRLRDSRERPTTSPIEQGAAAEKVRKATMERARRLLELCDIAAAGDRDPALRLEPLMLARFLASEGREER